MVASRAAVPLFISARGERELPGRARCEACCSCRSCGRPLRSGCRVPLGRFPHMEGCHGSIRRTFHHGIGVPSGRGACSRLGGHPERHRDSNDRGAGPAANQSVVIRNGRIAEIGPSAQVSVPDAASVVDGTGKYLIPGLFENARPHVENAGVRVRSLRRTRRDHDPRPGE